MNLYCAVVDAETVRMFYETTGIKLNVLISYFYIPGNAYKLTVLYKDMINSLYLDSGAFSVFTGRAKISPTGYRTYLKKYGHLFEKAFNLDDKLNDPAHNMSNQLFLEEVLSNELRPVPVIHDEKDPLEEFKSYVDHGHDSIALGSLGTHKKFDVNTVSSITEKYPDIKIHLFGNFDRDILTKCHIYSADSADWGHHAKYGSIYYWDPDQNQEYSLYVGGRDKTPPGQTEYKSFKNRKKVDDFLLKTFNYKYSDLLSDVAKMQIVNIYFFTQLEIYLSSIKR